MPTSTIGIKGFTLLELLIVVLIIGVLTSVVSLSINAARPSESQILYKSLESQVKLSQKISQLKNLKLRLIINENRSKVEQFDPSTHQWLNASEIQKVQWVVVSCQWLVVCSLTILCKQLFGLIK